MTQPDYASLFLDPLFAAFMALPGMFLAAAHAEPTLWTLPALLMVAIVVKVLPAPRRRQRRRSRW